MKEIDEQEKVGYVVNKFMSTNQLRKRAVMRGGSFVI
jgi:hypothetical protein